MTTMTAAIAAEPKSTSLAVSSVLDEEEPPSLSSSSRSRITSGAVDFISGAAAGTLGKFLEYPADAVKSKMQSQLPAYSGKTTVGVVSYVARVEGVRGFYAGVAAPAAGCALECSIAYSVFYSMGEWLTQGLPPRPPTERSRKHDFYVVAVAAGAGGICNGFVLTPIELIKCRVQCMPREYPTVRAALQKIVFTEPRGIRTLGDGLTPTLGRELVGSIGFFVAIEGSQRALFSRHLKPDGDVEETAPWYVLLVSGGFGGLGLMGPTFPMDTIKTHMQINPTLAREGFLATARHLLLKPGGVKNFFEGFGITMIRAFPSAGVIVTAAETLRARFS
jgi:ornithine carrier protein